mmetsp:Transcript_11224/g.21163  ORF Transcript_11224/g.21163 Transcript_11224/m.21163 type:complete len:224 (+) Transcript_11224:225-896(+)
MAAAVRPRLASFFRNAAQAGTIAAAADLTVQLTSSKSKSISDVDLRRTGSFFAFNFGYVGFFQRLVYLRFDTIFGVQNTMRVIGSKVAADTLIHGPFVYIPSFYLVTGLLQGYGFKGSFDRFRVQYADTMKAFLTIWFVPMIVFFRFVPDSHRVLFLASCGYIEKSAYSLLDQRRARIHGEAKARKAGHGTHETGKFGCKIKSAWTEYTGMKLTLPALQFQAQ